MEIFEVMIEIRGWYNPRWPRTVSAIGTRVFTAGLDTGHPLQSWLWAKTRKTTALSPQFFPNFGAPQ